MAAKDIYHDQVRSALIQDGMEDGIADYLERVGAVKTEIVLGFHPPELRQYTGYALT